MGFKNSQLDHDLRKYSQHDFINSNDMLNIRLFKLVRLKKSPPKKLYLKVQAHFKVILINLINKTLNKVNLVKVNTFINKAATKNISKDNI